MKLSAQELTKSFGEKSVLRGVSFEAESGKALGLLGRNGAGKTTAIRIIMRVFSPDSGRVLLDGAPLDPNRVRIGYLPEERGLYPKRKILPQLIYFGALAGLNKREAEQNARSLLKRLSMEEYADKRLDTLSKGNQQKIQLVATLIADPDIVILDEPFSGLDPVNAMLLKDLIKELIGRNKIVLFSSHQMNYIEEFCDEIAILNTGKIVLSGSIAKIKRSFSRDTLIIESEALPRLKEQIDNLPDGLISSCKETEGRLLIKLTDSENKKELFNALGGSADLIDAFYIKEPSLNEIFVKYTEAAV